MNKNGKINYISLRIKELYPEPEVALRHKDPFTLLVAVVLSSRCTDERVNKTTPALFDLANNPYDMAKLAPEQVQEIIRPCGLSPQKSKGIVGLSKIIAEKHNGEVPQTFEDLEALPSVGHKTASVVMTQAFGKPAFPVDTHIIRLAKRWKLSQGKTPGKIEQDLKRQFPEDTWHDLHLQMIYYGREHCSAWGCDGAKCEICRYLREHFE